MTKNSKEKLLRHPSVREVVDEFHVICKCGKKIKLDRKFDPDFLERHSKSSACKLTNNATQITNFFDKQTSNARRKLCHGLNNEKTKIYLRRVAGVTSYGGAPPVEDVDNDDDLNLSLQEINLLDNLDNNSITNLSFSVLDYENLYVSLYNQRVSHQLIFQKTSFIVDIKTFQIDQI